MLAALQWVMLQWRGPIELCRVPIAVLTPRGAVRTRKKPGRWSGSYPRGSPAEWLADGHVTCNIQCLNGHCRHVVDVRLDTLPQDQPWSRVGRNMICTECGAPGAVNIVPNWHDMAGRATPFGKG
jgi:hypothetical protein